MRSIIGFVLIAASLMAAGHYVQAHPDVLKGTAGLPELDTTNAISERFGQNAAIMLIARAKTGTMLDAATLTELDKTVKTLDRSGGCKSVLSFFALPVMVVGEEETDIQNLVTKVPTTDAEAAELKKRVLAHRNAVGELLSEDLTRAMLICTPLPNGTSIDPIIDTPLATMTLLRVGPKSLPKGLAHDLFFGGVFFLVALIPLISARFIKAASAGTMKQVLSLALVGGLLSAVTQAVLWPSSSLLGAVLGSSFDKASRELAEVTRADRTTLVRVDGDFNLAANVATVAQGCAKLGKGVACPTDVLVMLAGALTGDAKLPEKDDQLKALWFFAGDRPELSLIVAPDKQSMLVRVLDNKDVDPAAFGGLTVSVGGLPLVERALSRMHLALWGFAAILLVLGFVIKREAWPIVVSQALMVASAGMPILLLSRCLLVFGFATAITSRRKEGS